jgi:hypothetical protein
MELDKRQIIKRCMYMSKIFERHRVKADEYTAFALVDMAIFICKENGMSIDDTKKFFHEVIEFNRQTEKREVH